MTGPAGELLFSIPGLGVSRSCFDRLQAFLLTEPQIDGRKALTNRESSFEPIGTSQRPQLSFNPQESDTAINVGQVSISPSKSTAVVLKDVSFKIPRGSLTIITGPVGSGKSTLLKGLLGELPCETGSIYVNRKDMSYCAQTAWLPNGTFKEIICGTSDPSAIDEQWYESTVRACALEDDVLQLADSHYTTIGSRGVTLSGGQKQRLVCRYATRPEEMLT